MSNYTYKVPSSFGQRLRQYVKQQMPNDNSLIDALSLCEFEHENIGNAYYAGLRNTPWNSQAVDITFIGPNHSISIMEKHRMQLERAVSKALRVDESGLLLHVLYLLLRDDEIESFASNDDRLKYDVNAAIKVRDDIVDIAKMLSANSLYNSKLKEDNFNDYLRDSLINRGYKEVRDQTRQGLSFSEKGAGEVDILLSNAVGAKVVIECLKLTSVDKASIDCHIKKAVSNYNPLGYATFIVAYVSVDDFSLFWSKYCSHLQEYEFPFPQRQSPHIEVNPCASIRLASSVLSRDDYDFPVFFVAIKLCEPSPID